jgi:hypothetical protein
LTANPPTRSPSTTRQIDDVLVLPWRQFLRRLWQGELLA